MIMDEKIYNAILEIKSNSNIISFDEATTKQTIILKFLYELGWNFFDANEVTPEYSVKDGRVDYSLRLNNENKVFLEIKKVSVELESHQEQLLRYSFQAGIKLAVLTNGISWWFYLPLKEGNWEQRKFFAIDIMQQQPRDIARHFIEFLSKENISTESAVRIAEDLLNGKAKELKIQQNLPKAWHKIVSQPDELLIELINETLEKICGHKAEDTQIIEFINKYINTSAPILEKSLNWQKETIPKLTQSVRTNSTSRELPEDDTECRFTYKNKTYVGIIKEGMLCVENQKFKSFSGASVEISQTSRNGWIDWEIKLPNTNQWLLANIWRKE